MSGIQDFLIGLAFELRRVFMPLEEALGSAQAFSELLARHGWLVDPTQINLQGIRSTIDIADDIKLALEVLADTLSEEISISSIEKYQLVVEKLQHAFITIQELESRTPPADLSNLWSDFASELPDSLIAQYLEQYRPSIYAILLIFGIVKEESVETGGALNRQNYVRRIMQWELISEIITNPGNVFQNLYSWNHLETPLNYDFLFRNLSRSLSLITFPIASNLQKPAATITDKYYSEANPYRSQVPELQLKLINWEDEDGNDISVSLAVVPVPSGDNYPSSQPPTALLIRPVINISNMSSNSTKVAWPFGLELSGDFQTDDGIRLFLSPPASVTVNLGTSGTINASVAAFCEPTSPQILFGSRDSHHISLYGWKAGLYLAGPLNTLDLSLKLRIDDALFVFDPGDGDSFVQKILGSERQEANFGGSLIWSSRSGFYFEGNGGLELNFALHKALGPIDLKMLTFAIRAFNNSLELVSAVTATALLGPITVSVERIGVALVLRPKNQMATFGTLDLNLAFKPPDGAGLAIDATVIVGGGYLFFDPENEQYAGVLQLEIQDVLSIKAIGLLTTRMPDGSKGFSLLIIISAQFPPIQLGFGFSLNGLGGLLGVNRTMELDVLRAGVKNRTLDSIMFPENPVANASRIISDLQSVFPPVSGRFVFGPMAELSWGKPATILTIQLGIVLELPSPVRLAIMGKLTLVLPTLEVPEEAQVVVLHLDVLGTIDFATGDAGIDATLYDSRIATFPITGDMAMRLNWGASPAFALSVGGFHPRFQPPPNFPSLDRLAIALSTSDNPLIRLEAYLAMTTNSVQLGAWLDIYAEMTVEVLGKFSASGFLGFDALVHFPPFSFVVDIEGGVAIKHNGNPILSATLYITLSGPEPWHAWGEATLDFFGKRVIPIYLTVGHALPPLLVPPGDPHGELLKALADARNWSAQLPSDGHMLVTLREIEVSNEVLLHPLGELTFRQKVVPLDTAISKFGSATSNNPGPFTFADILFDGLSTQSTRETVKDLWAPGDFFEMSDEEKVARPSFESMPSGCTHIATDEISTSKNEDKVTASFQYDTVVIDNKEALVSRRGNDFKYEMAQAVLLATADLGAAGQSAMRSTGSTKFAGDSNQRVRINDPEYAVTSTEDMSQVAELSSYTEAEAARRAKGIQKDQYQVVGKQEVG